MSDRLAVMNGGRIEQLGAPRDLYERPATRFVADFLGTSNILSGRLERDGERWGLGGLGPGERVLIDRADGLVAGQEVEVVVRPEKMALADAASEPPARHSALRCKVEEIVYLGTSTSYSVVTDGGATVSVYRQNVAAAPGEEIAQGQVGWLSWPPEHSYVLGSTPAAKEGTRS